MACYVVDTCECETICTTGTGTVDQNCLANCLAYYCPEGLPAGSCGSGFSSSSGGGIDMELTPEMVESVMAAFNLGFQSGVLSFIKIVGIGVMVLVIISLVNYAISKN